MDTNSYGGQYASDGAASPATREAVGSGRYLSDQQESVARLHDAIQKLGNVLEPVLMPEPPAAQSEAKSPQIMRAMPLTSVTAGRIRENTEAIDIAVSRILRLIDRAQETV